MRDFKIENGTTDFSVIHKYDLSDSDNKSTYDIYSLACFVAEKMDEEMLAESAYNEIAENIRGVQLNLSTLYIVYLELIAEGKIIKNDIPRQHNDIFMFIGNQLEFLDKLGSAFQGISIKFEQVTKSKEVA